MQCKHIYAVYLVMFGQSLMLKQKNLLVILVLTIFDRSGYFGRLQQVMQIERDRHFEFLKQSQTGGKSPLSKKY